MGSSGHAFIAHTKALSPGAQPKEGGYGPPPHPRVIRPGQRHWPRVGRRRAVLAVRRVDGERAVMDHPDRGQAPTGVTIRRLLSVRVDGQGRQYQFQRFPPRRYVTCAYVWSVEDRQAVLCVPEWHPRRAVRLPVRLLPLDGRWAAAWLRARCDLSASSAGRLQLGDPVSWTAPDLESIAAPALDAQAGQT